MRGRNVFVAGGGNSAGQAALHLAKWARQVTILVRAPSLAASMSDYLIRQIGAAPNIDVRYRVQVAGGTGTSTGHLQSLVLQDTASGAAADGPRGRLVRPHRRPAADRMARPGRRPRPVGVHPHRPGPARQRPRPLARRPAAAATGDQPARGVRRRRRAPRISQTGRLRGRRRRRHHPPGTPLPSTSRRGAGKPSPASTPAGNPRQHTTGTQPAARDLAHAHRAQHDRHPHTSGARKWSRS